MNNKKKFKLKDVWHYIQGHVRYFFYYWKNNYFFNKKWIRWIFLIPLQKLLPLHIREQITIRINSMNQQCYLNGSCKMCGCKTTHLQMANKACEGLCYPQMQTKKNWNLLKNKKIVISNKKAWQVNNSRFKQYELATKNT